MSDADTMDAGPKKGSAEASPIRDFLVNIGFKTEGLADLKLAAATVRSMNEPEIRLECLRLALANLGSADCQPDLSAWLGVVDNVTSHFADIVFDEPKDGDNE